VLEGPTETRPAVWRTLSSTGPPHFPQNPSTLHPAHSLHLNTPSTLRLPPSLVPDGDKTGGLPDPLFNRPAALLPSSTLQPLNPRPMNPFTPSILTHIYIYMHIYTHICICPTTHTPQPASWVFGSSPEKRSRAHPLFGRPAPLSPQMLQPSTLHPLYT